jgi:hypothetical protein
LGQTVDTADNFAVSPTILNVVGGVVLGDEFLGDVIEVDADEFRAVKEGAEVEVDDVKGAEFGTCVGEDAVDH